MSNIRSKLWASKLFMTRPSFFNIGFFMAHTGKNIDSCIPNRHNYCVIFVVYTQFMNVAAGRIITTWRVAAQRRTL